ncbi:serine/threonine-protein kinase [Streptomyces sp. NBC_00820]|uniref:serine/threonine-protein kinase n=1 Tax=Streptomyces sp. NBC_00820 TaxID=2975842 RepID=UPI002ED2F858|nr:serine/threonine-protein kinase [Streptomyces sp. NBC_00820]
MAPQRNTGASAEAELPEYAGHYRLESRLGSGGMGVVHLARSASGMKLAVKVVHAGYAKDPEFRSRFRQEVAAARTVSGAFTAPVVDADPEAGRPWMATLFIPGPTLSDQIKDNGPMEPARLRRLMAGLAEALRDIHRVGVVHRDLKPGNVLLAEDGPKVIDFGISRPKNSELRTETGKLIGTPPFMAPEQFRRPREVGPAADIFALGSLMVHAATGRGPFDSDSPYVVAYQVVHDEPDLTGMPESLAPLVLRCLAKEPEDRPTPDELMRELRSVAALYDTQAFIPEQRTRKGAPERKDAPAQESPGAAPPRRPGRRLRRNVALGAGVFALVVSGATAMVQWLGDSDAPVPRAGVRSAPAGFAPWRANPAGEGSGMPRCSYGSGKLFCFRSGLAFALDATDGTPLWRRSVAGERTSGTPVLADGLLRLPVDGDRRVETLDPVSGRTRWSRDIPAHGGTLLAGGTLLLADPDGSVTGLDGGSGDERWHRRISGTGTPSLAMFAGDPLAYAVTTSEDGTHSDVTAVDPATGAARWGARLDGTLRPVGSQDGTLYLLSVDSTTGDTTGVLRYTPASKSLRRVALPVPRLAPQAGVHGGVVYLLATDGALEAFDVATGKRLWSLQTSVSRGSAPVASGDHVYFSAADGRLLAVDAGDGRLLGQTPPRLGAHSDELTADLPAPLLADGHLYATAPDGTVFTVDGRDPSAW